MSFPAMLRKHPKLRLIFVGFGIYREHLELMIDSMVSGDKELFKAAAHCIDEQGISFLESSVDIDASFQTLGIVFSILSISKAVHIRDR